jgi:hypothetical protein
MRNCYQVHPIMPIGSSYDEKPQMSIAAASTAIGSQEEELEETN